MRIARPLLLAALALLPAGSAVAAPAARTPISADILFLPPAARDIRFAHMDRFYSGHIVRAGGAVKPLPPGKPLPIAAATVATFMRRARVAGLIVVQDGRVRLERYVGGGPQRRWTSFSVAKSVSSTLVGAAIRDGAIASIDDPVTRYLPALAGSAYDGVTIAQLLAMRSGVAWNEDYADPRSDVAQLYSRPPPPGEDRTVAYMARLSRAAAPGTRWNYSTGETDLVGELVRAATHRSLADYLSTAVWRRYGMADNAFWLTDTEDHEAGGSGLSMTLRDMARLGLLALTGGAGIVPAGWFAAAIHPISIIDAAGDGYGRLWWTYPGDRFAARGIFGQSILVDPASRTVIAISADWPHATDPALSAARAQFEAAVLAAATASASRLAAPRR